MQVVLSNNYTTMIIIILPICIHYLYLIFTHIYFYVGCLYTYYLFRQTSSSQFGTAYRLQAAVPENMWARLSGTCEGNIPLPIIDIYFRCVLLVAKVVAIRGAFEAR